MTNRNLQLTTQQPNINCLTQRKVKTSAILFFTFFSFFASHLVRAHFIIREWRLLLLISFRLNERIDGLNIY